MEEQLISFETAKLAKEKGFDESTLNWYHKDTKKFNTNDLMFSMNKLTNNYSAPTQSLLQKWLREVHKIHIEPQHSWLLDENKKTRDDVVWWYYIYSNYPHGGRSKTFSCEIGEPTTYEEALEQGLQEALKLIKQ